MSWNRAIGFKFPDITENRSTPGTLDDTVTDNAVLYGSFGTGLNLNDTTGIGLELAGDFGTTTKNETPSWDATSSGKFFGDLTLEFWKSAQLGDKITVSAYTPLDIALVSVSGDTSDTTTFDMDDEVYFGLKAGINVGAKYQATKKFAFYTGIEMTALNWTVNSWADGSDDPVDNKGNDWAFEIFGTGAIPKVNLGMTFTPIDNLVIGLGLNNLIDSGNNTYANPFTTGIGGKIAVSYKF
ncbi:hypothetical protein AGMMS49944_31730 [Spirochaetia bacterium]|nr:hypothetical protein AGMMS49944_31730 [Spirochaetia bacterium]